MSRNRERSKPPDPMTELVVAERGVVLAVAVEQKVAQGDREDLVHDVLVLVLRLVARGTFVTPEGKGDMRAVVRSYLATTARRLVWRESARSLREQVGREPMEPTFDPTPRFEARSELRALDLPPVSAAFVAAIASEGNVLQAATRLGWRQGTAYSRLVALRRDVRAALHRRGE